MGHLALHGVSLAHGARRLLENVQLDVRPGELVAIVGPNGVGKTTLLRAMAGFFSPAAGEIALDGVPVRALSPRERAREISLVAGDGELPLGMTVGELVLTGRYSHRPWWDWSSGEPDVQAAGAALARVGLRAFAERPFATLSAGERQRAWIALAIAQEARVVLLDEPTSHLDPRYALDVLALLRGLARERTSAVVILHDLNEAAAVADRIAVLGAGRLLAYAAPEDALDPEILERAFGVAFDRIAVEGSIRVLPRGPLASRPHPISFAGEVRAFAGD
jgi:ABC-type cobalamin/Fe3+-siderophores transport system ATPase subunit